MGMFEDECAQCGSKEHATEDCPHGPFADRCARCDSREHATESCPHDVFNAACDRCGSREHATSDCPHSAFESQCAQCGSTEHATSDCPHGFLQSECARCGSHDHATSACPHDWPRGGGSTGRSSGSSPSSAAPAGEIASFGAGGDGGGVSGGSAGGGGTRTPRRSRSRVVALVLLVAAAAFAASRYDATVPDAPLAHDPAPSAAVGAFSAEWRGRWISATGDYQLTVDERELRAGPAQTAAAPSGDLTRYAWVGSERHPESRYPGRNVVGTSGQTVTRDDVAREFEESAARVKAWAENDPDAPSGGVEISRSALATLAPGDYERFWIFDARTDPCRGHDVLVGGDRMLWISRCEGVVSIIGFQRVQ